ncbi:MAG: helix-turn-helix transcriptional regulator [Clostridiales bacterium]|nr:helix-turn-helix transcriptional regulator [Clostridiales bacterium]
MKFHEKLQELRKQKGLTQEELAAQLYVSRTAVSKWESGRGYPNIESLKMIAKFYGFTIDDLLSGNELLATAEEESRQKKMHVCDLIFGFLDCGYALLLFLPVFGQRVRGNLQEVSLLLLTEIAPYMRAAYFLVVVGMIVLGVLTLALQNCHYAIWEHNKRKFSLFFNTMGVIFFIMGLQPYAAAFSFIYLIIKGFLLIKKP